MAAQAPPQPPVVNPWVIAIAVMFGTFMEVLDTTVVNVSLPHIAGSLSATVDEATWALTSYLVANAVVLPMTGWLANFFGRKRLLNILQARCERLGVKLVFECEAKSDEDYADADLVIVNGHIYPQINRHPELIGPRDAACPGRDRRQ